jgi:hypothetical protein
MGVIVGDTVQGLYHAVFRPSRLVAVPGRRTDQSIGQLLRQSWQLLVVYLVNLVLYAGPLTLAGIGITSGSSVPGWLVGITGEDPGTTVLFLAGFLQNSLYLLGVTVATLVGVHFALLVTLQSDGFFRTAYSIVYSTSIYLAGIFTIVWYLTTAGGVANAREAVINLQVAFIYGVIDLLGSDITFQLARPETIVPGSFSPVGEAALVGLAVLVVYYFYSLYLGTRLNHDAGRFESLLVVIVVVALPVLYVVGSIVVTTIQQGSMLA